MGTTIPITVSAAERSLIKTCFDMVKDLLMVLMEATIFLIEYNFINGCFELLHILGSNDVDFFY